MNSSGRSATYAEVFAVPEFRVLFAGFGVSLIGETVKMLALSVLIYTATGSPLLAAVAYVAGFLPHALGGTFLLALADRWRPRTILVGYDLIRLLLAASLAAGLLPPAAMLGLVFAVGTIGPISSATRSALLPDLLDGDAYVLGRSLFTVVSGTTQVLGFGVGGLLLALVGPHGALWLAAGTCGLSAILIRFGLADRPARATGRGGAIRQTWRVNGSLMRDRRVRGLLLAQWLPGTLIVGGEGVIVPYAGQLGAESLSGVLFMASALGMLCGDLVVGRFVPPARRERLTPWLAVLLGVPLLLFAARPGPVAAAALFGTATFGFSYQLGLARRFLDAVPQSRRGQSFGLVTTGMMTLQGLAAAGAGALGEWLAPGLVIALAGAASLSTTTVLWRRLRPDVDPGVHRGADPGAPVEPAVPSAGG